MRLPSTKLREPCHVRTPEKGSPTMLDKRGQLRPDLGQRRLRPNETYSATDCDECEFHGGLPSCCNSHGTRLQRQLRPVA